MLKLTLDRDECVIIGDHMIYASKIIGSRIEYSIIGPEHINVCKSKLALRPTKRPLEPTVIARSARQYLATLD